MLLLRGAQIYGKESNIIQPKELYLEGLHSLAILYCYERGCAFISY